MSISQNIKNNTGIRICPFAPVWARLETILGFVLEVFKKKNDPGSHYELDHKINSQRMENRKKAAKKIKAKKPQ